jgi:hypothetical protein
MTHHYHFLRFILVAIFTLLPETHTVANQNVIDWQTIKNAAISFLCCLLYVCLFLVAAG